ncbi:hypothetical protein HPB48_017582 [Haemaphysalis longicornis]|uniref:Uncharacterized protein n=1 Tax=Haemaphysalis longicornis TaxID=44386 RepID=A0A9J6GTH9_HAELO|nr:hypothetical protein HPB48_017582 [Haemaphysalis longicornis]
MHGRRQAAPGEGHPCKTKCKFRGEHRMGDRACKTRFITPYVVSKDDRSGALLPKKRKNFSWT